MHPYITFSIDANVTSYVAKWDPTAGIYRRFVGPIPLVDAQRIVAALNVTEPAANEPAPRGSLS